MRTIFDLKKIDEFRCRIDGKDKKSSDPDRVTLDTMLQIAEDEDPVFGVSVEERKWDEDESSGHYGTYFSFYTVKSNPDLLFSDYKNYLPGKFTNHLNLKLDDQRLIISMVDILSLAEIIKDNTFYGQISSWDEQLDFKVSSLKQFQSFFLTEYSLSLAEKATSPVPEDIAQPPSKKKVEQIKNDLKKFYNFYSSELNNSILVNETDNSLTISSITDCELVLPITNYHFMPSNRDFIDYKPNCLNLLIKHNTIQLKKSNNSSKKVFVEKDDMFYLNEHTDIIYNTNLDNLSVPSEDKKLEDKKYLTKEKLFNSHVSFSFEDTNLSDVILGKISAVKGYKYLDNKRTSNKDLADFVTNYLGLK